MLLLSELDLACKIMFIFSLQQISPEHSSNSGNETEVPQPLFPYYQLHPQTTNDNATVYNTVTDADPYVNGTPRPHQMLRIPPPPSIPLPPPPPPSNPGGTACLDPWGGGTIGREKELIQHSSMNSTQSAPNNNFYRYSLPVNGGFPATPVYSAPVWTATSGEDPRVVQQAQAAQHFPMSQEASDLPGTHNLTHSEALGLIIWLQGNLNDQTSRDNGYAYEN